jgi:hypothetical protein
MSRMPNRLLLAAVVKGVLLAWLLGVPAERGWGADATPDCGQPQPNFFPERERAAHLARLGADRWHAAGYRGQGVKVLILDSGFRGYRAHLGAALPSRVLARSFRHDGNVEARDSQHGILCAEVFHAIAPDAELLFANWEPDRPATFLEAVRWARELGARLVSCSVIMPSWSDGEGRGPIHEALARLLGNGKDPADLLFFASAGNIARRHWTGEFHDDGQGRHLWRNGKIDNAVTPWGLERVSVELCWSTATRYRLSVHDALTGERVGSACNSARDRNCAVVRFLPGQNRRYRVRVELLQGEPGPFHLISLGGDLECWTTRGSIPFPADGPEVLAVGAVDADGERESYSSCGPNSSRPKPDFVAVVPFASLWRARPFAGTSAASPQVAALAALWWSRHPHWTAEQVRSVLRQSARDLGAPGHDWETGHGLARLPGLDDPLGTAPVLAQPTRPAHHSIPAAHETANRAR